MASRIDERRAALRRELDVCRQRLQEFAALEQRLIGALVVLEELAAEPATVPQDGGAPVRVEG